MMVPETLLEGSLNGHFSLTRTSIQVKLGLHCQRGLIVDMITTQLAKFL